MLAVNLCATPSPREGSAAGRDGPTVPSYAAALHRYFARLETRDFTLALDALDEAIEIEPDLVEGYHLRARLWRLLGDYVRASRDYATCLALDPHCGERDEIHRAVQAVTRAFRTDPVVDDGWAPASCRDDQLQAVLLARIREASRRRAIIESPACSLPCPSICCHFEEESYVYGVHVSPAELPSLRAFLRGANLREAEHVSRLPRNACPATFRGRDEWFVRDEDGEEYLYYPLRGDKRLGPMRLAMRPRSVGGAEIAWLTERSHGCSFLTDAGCLVHEVGDPPGLNACRCFLCLTGFVYVVLRYLDVVADEELTGRPIEQLHEDAIAALPPLARACAGSEIAAAQTAMRKALAAAIDADASGDPAARRSSLSEYEASRAHLERHQGRQLLAVRTLVHRRR